MPQSPETFKRLETRSAYEPVPETTSRETMHSKAHPAREARLLMLIKGGKKKKRSRTGALFASHQGLPLFSAHSSISRILIGYCASVPAADIWFCFIGVTCVCSVNMRLIYRPKCTDRRHLFP